MNDVQSLIATLHHAAKHGDARAVDHLLMVHRPLVDVPDASGHTALHIAAKRNHPQVVRVLLQRGADAHAKSRCGSTALQMAQQRGHTQVIAALAANWKM